MKSSRIILYSLVSIVLSYYISVLLHEYSHATMAWILGYKKSPFDILYGSWFLLPVSENVDYQSIFASAHPLHGGMIGVSGISMTILLFLISLFFLKQQYRKNNGLFIFFFWMAAINLMEIFSYVPNRTFITGDITEFCRGFGFSPLWVFFPGMVLTCLALYRFYHVEIPKLYALISAHHHALKRILLYLTFWPLTLLVAYWVPPTKHIILSYAANFLSIFLVLFIVCMCDPARVKGRQKSGIKS